MKVLLVIPRGEVLGGAQRHVVDLAESIRTSGHSAEVAIGTDGPVAQELRNLGFEVRVLRSLVRGFNPLSDFAAASAVRAIAKSTQADVISAHSFKGGLVTRLVAMPCPVIYTVHGWGFTEGKAPLIRGIALIAELVLSNRTKHFVAVSNYDLQLGRRFKVAPEDRSQLVHNGTRDFLSGSTDSESSDSVLFSMFARFDEPKDQSSVIEATAAIVDLCRIKVRLYGDGPNRRNLEQLIQSHNLGDVVELYPFLNPVDEALGESDAVLMISKWEAFPLAVVEALSAAKPVIASDVGGIPEAIVHGQNGMLVPPGDTAALADAMLEVASSSETRQRLGAAARESFESKFRIEMQMKKIVEILEQCSKP